MREQNALPTRFNGAKYKTAKDAVNNGGVGRAAKSEILFSAPKNKTGYARLIFLFIKR